MTFEAGLFFSRQYNWADLKRAILLEVDFIESAMSRRYLVLRADTLFNDVLFDMYGLAGQVFAGNLLPPQSQ